MDLLITTGHNSSAILVENGKIINGYEEERLTRVKADSRFPINSINKLIKNRKIDKIFVTHWFDNYDFYKNYYSKINKYYNYEFINNLIKEHNAELITLSEQCTHQDTHAYAALAFYYNYKSMDFKEKHIIAADGFGNRQEVYAVYKSNGNKIEKILSCNGYENSLGLMYQFATEFCGMKPKQDEYKFLGYESKILDIGIDINILKNISEKKSDEIFKSILKSTKECPMNDYIDIEKLEKVKEIWFNFYNKVLIEIDYKEKNDKNEFNKRCIIGFVIQWIIENVNKKIIKHFNIKRILLSGGIFYNVKLNNSIMNIVDEISIIPIAGDQCNAIGLYYKKTRNIDLSTLCIGKRNFKKIYSKLPNIIYFDNKKDLVNKAIELLKKNKIPQIYLGNMEFGPRALCHSSTLCKPTQKNVSFINRANNRNEIMPCAPVILEENLDYFFHKKDYEKVIGSDEFMILTYDYKIPFQNRYSGIMHKYPLEEKYSGRPQVIRENQSTIYHILSKINDKALVNTSLNYHGKPIVFSVNDAIEDFTKQQNNSENPERLYLLIGLYEES